MPWQQLITDGCKNVFEWGPGLLLAIIILYGIYKILLHFGKEVGLKIIGAMEKPAAALDNQAHSMDRLTNSLQQYVGRDQKEHREIIILQKVILERIETLGRDANGGDQKRTL